ncbi:hypothetical protein MPSEU_000883500 [Mayamaea pseudoterrestris]|nr:hypothetical protein MPSEU_000883500 [Mayamaea pseudoterrestris]
MMASPPRALPEDDEDLTSLLLSSPASISASNLQQLAERFLADSSRQRDDTSPLQQVIDAAQDLGVPYHGFMQNISALANKSVSDNDNSNIPEAFETVQGKRHLEAAMALLQCSKSQAVDYTLGTLVKTTAASDITRYLGTPTLLEKLLHYSYRQRLARLTAIGELLRLEQEPDNHHDAAATATMARNILNALDETIKIQSFTSSNQQQPQQQPQAEHHSRGLFRMLLSRVMLQQETFSIDQLLPAKQLCLSKNKSDQQVHSDWQHLNAVLLQIQRAFYNQERVLAMQVLATLLYSRMSVHRRDIVVLLLFFQSNDDWFTSSPAASFYNHDASTNAATTKELARLAALIGVECMSLWRVTMDEKWVHNHPLLQNLFDQEDAVALELKIIKSLLEKYLQQITNRRLVHGTLETPESLVALAYGLLLMVAHAAILTTSHGATSGAYWQHFSDDGANMVMASNDAFSFEYFDTAMRSLVPPVESRLSGRRSDQNATITDGATLEVATELNATALTFASIGRELLSTAVIAFDDTLLSLAHDGAADNISMLTKMAITVHQNSPTLCRRFWSDWENIHLAPNIHRMPVPICCLMDKAYELSTKSKIANTLPGVAPLLRMVSAIVYNADSTNKVLVHILPAGAVRMALVSCTSDKVSEEQRRIVLDSLRVLSITGASAMCRTLLRNALDKNNDSLIDKADRHGGPQLLITIGAGDNCNTKCALTIVGALAVDAPERWVLASAQHILHSTKMAESLGIDETKVQTAFVSYIGIVVERMNNILHSPWIRMEEKTAFLVTIERAIRGCASLLSALVSTIGKQARYGASTLETIYEVLVCLTNALVSVRPATTHALPEIRQAISDLRTALVTLCAASHNLGGTLLHFATLPVSLSLANDLFDYLQESNMTDETAISGSYKLQALQQVAGSLESAQNPVQFLADKVDSVEIEFDGVYAKGWLSGEDIQFALQAAQQAMDLLIMWGLNVEDMAVDDDELEIITLSPYHALLESSLLPAVCHFRQGMLATWTTVDPSFLSLLLRCLDNREPDNNAARSANFLALCVIHAKRQLNGKGLGETMFRKLYQSRAFAKLSTTLTKELLPNIMMSTNDALHDTSKISLASALLRTLSICCEISASMALKALGKSPEDAVSSLCVIVTNVVRDIDRQDVNEQPSLKLLRHLEVASQCLRVLLSVWRQARRAKSDGDSSDSLKAILVEEHALTFQLASFLFRAFGSPLSLEPDFNFFLAFIHDLLSTEIKWAIESAGDDGKQTLVNMLDSIKDDRFVSVTTFQTSLKQYPCYVLAYSKLSSRLTALSNESAVPSELVMLLSLSSRLGDVLRQDQNSRAWRQESQYLSSFAHAASHLSELTNDFEELKFARRNVASEIRRLKSWVLFCNRLSVLLRMARLDDKVGSIKCLNSTNVIECSRAIACALLDHLRAVKHAETELTASGVVSEGMAMAGHLAACLLNFVELCGSNDEVGVDVIESVDQCLAEFYSVNVTNLEVGELLLTIASALYALRPPLNKVNAVEEARVRFNNTKLRLVQSCCNAIRKLDSVTATADVRQIASCFRCALTLLATVVASFAHTQETQENDRLASEALEIYVNGDTIRTIDRLLKLLSSNAPGANDTQYVGPLLSSLELLTALALSKSPTLLTMMMVNNVSSFVNRVSVMVCSFFAHEPNLDGTTYRAKGSVSQMHQACLRFLSAILHVANLSESSTNISSQCIALAIDYFATITSIFECLKQSSTVPNYCLRLNVLQECELVLSISATLCSNGANNLFAKTCPELFQTLISCSRNLIVAVGSFLGASAAARERFAAIDADDADTSDHQNNRQGPVSLADRLLRNGAPNTKHEAIRFSHLRYEHYENDTIDNDELAESKQGVSYVARRDGEESPHSLMSLEQKCRLSVYSQFAFELELKAAECLFLASTILMKTHPASSAFVRFTSTEVARLDGLSLAKNGSTIAFRRGRSPKNQLSPQNGRPIDSCEALTYGEVIQVDTFNRLWQVRISDGTSEVVVVNESELAGIEDSMKLRCVLAYRPAPETASELEQTLVSASTGHLLLALRWCHNISKLDVANSSSASLIHRLTEVLAIFVAKELSIHRKIGSPSMLGQPGYVPLIASQIFDLFGVESTSDLLQSSHRSVHPILSSQLWAIVRLQLHHELANAAQDQELYPLRGNRLIS